VDKYLNRIPWQIKLGILMLLMAILPGLIISYSVTNLIFNELKGNINEKLIFSSNSISSGIESKIKKSLEILDLIKSAVESPNTSAKEKIEFMISNIKKINNIVSITLFIEEGGAYSQAFFAGKDFLRKNNNEVVQVDSSQETPDLQSLNIKELKLPYISTPVYNKKLKTWICWEITEAKLNNLQPAYLACLIDLSEIEFDIENHLLNKIGTLFVTDSSGKKFLTNQFLLQLPDKIIDDAKSLTKNRNKVTLINNYSDPKLGDYVSSFSSPESVNWIVVSNISKSSAYAVVNQALIFFLIFVAISIILSIIIAYLFSKHLSRPIIKMAKVSQSISRGNFDVGIDYMANDSIGLLSNSLSTMGKQLKKNFSEIESQKVQLEEYSKNLEKKVEERTNKLSESNFELKKAYKKVLELSEEKDEFLGFAAHDLKNPLIAISSLADTVKRDKDISLNEHDELLNEIIKTSNRMVSIIKNLLDVNAIEQGKLNIKLEKVPVIPVIAELKKLNRENIVQKNLTLVETYDNNECAVLADNNLTFQIIQNLLSNAIKFSPVNSNIYVSARLVENNEMVEIRIKDEGPGFTEDDKKKLFHKFARLSARPIGGAFSTGLGLSIVKKLVDMLNGGIILESEKGKGAEFIVSFHTFKED
jgi:signal transduction histidine kinase